MTEPMGTADSKKGIADAVRKGLRRRYAKEMRFKFYGLAAIAFAMLTLVVLFTTIISSGIGAFVQSKLTLDVTFSAEDIDASDIGAGNFRSIAFDALRKEFPSAPSGRKSRPLTELLSSGAPFQLRQIALEDPGVVGTTRQVEMTFSDDADIFLKGKMTAIEDVPVTGIGSVVGTDGEVKILSTANDFNAVLADVKRSLADLASAQEREVRRAERRLGAMESELSALQTRLQSASGDAAAALQERVEALQNDIAAVPSIVFGLLGLALCLNVFGLPRSAPLVGGLVLTLMTLPTIIIASRAALKSVPPSIREAALGMGASRLQAMTHHVLPLALPGMLTGTIIGMAQALGETAPLLMIGMVAFIVDVPGGPTDPATVLPVQIFLWADAPERAFVERTSAAIMVLLAFLITMNLSAVLLRKKFETRW